MSTTLSSVFPNGGSAPLGSVVEMSPYAETKFTVGSEVYLKNGVIEDTDFSSDLAGQAVQPNAWGRTGTKIGGFSFAVDDATGTILSTAAGDGEVSVSTDEGNTWSTYNVGRDSNITHVEYSGGVFLAFGDLPTDDSGVIGYRSTDGGVTWSDSLAVLNNTSNSTRGLKASSNGTILAIRGSNYLGVEYVVHRSTDGGVSWTEEATLEDDNGYDIGFEGILGGFDTDGAGNWAIMGGRTNSQSESGFATSSDDGITWTKRPWQTGHTYHESLAFDGAGDLWIHYAEDNSIAANFRQFYLIKTTDLGVTWGNVFDVGATYGASFSYETNSGGIIYNSTSGILLAFKNKADPTYSTKGVMVYSKDNGATWNEVLIPISSSFFSITDTYGDGFIGGYNNAVYLSKAGVGIPISTDGRNTYMRIK